MFAVIVNTAAIILGTTVGLLLRRGIPKHISESIMKALGLCTVVIGMQGAVAEERILLMIVACVLGVLIGEWQDWEGRVNRLTERIASHGCHRVRDMNLFQRTQIGKDRARKVVDIAADG